MRNMRGAAVFFDFVFVGVLLPQPRPSSNSLWVREHGEGSITDLRALEYRIAEQVLTEI